jgi:glycine cleavage system H lipoate-binding protein
MSFILNISKTLSTKSIARGYPQTRKVSTVKYTPEHEWVKFDDKDPSVGVVGISKFCAETMREVLHVSRLPKPGDKLKKQVRLLFYLDINNQSDRIASVESYKAEIEFAAPVSKKIHAVITMTGQWRSFGS